MNDEEALKHYFGPSIDGAPETIEACSCPFPLTIQPIDDCWRVKVFRYAEPITCLPRTYSTRGAH